MYENEKLTISIMKSTLQFKVDMITDVFITQMIILLDHIIQQLAVMAQYMFQMVVTAAE